MLWPLAVSAAMAPDLQFRHYTTDNGAPSNRIRDVAQDADGFVWLATDGGVARFDGYEFKVYNLDGLQPGISDDNFAMSLCSTGDDLWVGTDAHLFKYDREGDTFAYVPLGDDRIDVRDIKTDRDGNLWLSVVNRGLVKVRPGPDGYEYEAYPIGDGDYFGRVYVDKRNDIWCAAYGDGLLRLDKSANRFRPVTLDIAGASAAAPAALADADDHTLWMATNKGLLVRFDPYSGKGRAVNATHPLVRVHSMQVVGDGLLLIGTDAGLVKFDTQSGAIDEYLPDELFPGSISDQFVYPIVKDREGGVWIGTFYGGLNYLAPNIKNFERYQTSKYYNSVSGNVISRFVEDGKGNVYIASDDGGLSRYDQATGHFDRISLGQRQGSDNVHALMLDGRNLWAGTYGDGVYVVDTDTRRVVSHLTDSELPTGDCYALLRTDDGAVWIGSGTYAVRRDPATGTLERLRNLSATIVDIDADRDGNVWFSTSGQGLYAYDPANATWRHYMHTGASGTLPHNHVNCLHIDSAGQVWMGSETGLSRYDRASDAFIIEPLPIGAPAEVYSIVEDQGVLWLTTAHGLVKYAHDGSVDIFTRSDGLASVQFMPNSIYKASNGKIYVGTRSGYTAFFPYQIKDNPYLPSVFLTGVDIWNKPLQPIDEHLPKGLLALDKLTLDYDENNFGITFASLSYANPAKNQYEYRLRGFDKDWVQAGARNHAVYSNLPIGHYTFEVKGSNSDNLWNGIPAQIDIEVRPPWYWSWPMQVVYLLLLCGILVLGVRLLLRQSEKKHKVELRRISSDKEIEVYQAKLSFFTMVAHEIRTPVSLIIGPLEKLMRTPEKMPAAAAADLNVIQRNSQRLLFLVNQLLDFKKVEETGMSVQFRHVDVAALINSVADRFRPTLEQKGIALDVDIDLPEGFTADIDPEAVTKLVSNLTNNARKFTADRIGISVRADKDWLMIDVTDNGVGISKANLKKIFRPFYQVVDENNQSRGGTGLGLSIVQGVVEAHKGTIDVRSEVGKGATFAVKLPLVQAIVVEDVPGDAQPEDKAMAQKPEPETKKQRMLVADDNEELCNFIANSFSDKYDVIMAENGAEALQALKHNDVSLIISDWMMPKMDGVELCKAVREDKNLSHIPFVLLTAKTDNHSKIEGLNCGADAYIEKPFSVQVLEARIDNLLQMRDMLRQKYSQTPLEPIQTVAPHPVDNEFLTQLNAIIEENFSNPELDIDFLASKMDMSRSSLYSKIRSLVDVTPNDLIRLTRLKHAAKLLVEGKYRINEVCYMVGFNSSSYFAKCFQKQFGQTPSEFVSQAGK